MSAQHSVHPNPGRAPGPVGVGVIAFSSTLRDLELGPPKWRSLIPPTRRYIPYGDIVADCWAAIIILFWREDIMSKTSTVSASSTMG
ncbi:MAG TPA: hypothetical protein VLE49_07615 [Anaerolineales bacterium]|nr:hypothetical protein [Anaerolineales bacterium]